MEKFTLDELNYPALADRESHQLHTYHNHVTNFTDQVVKDSEEEKIIKPRTRNTRSTNFLSHPRDFSPESHNRDANACRIQHPIWVEPMSNQLTYASVRIPISPIATGKNDRQIDEIAANNEFHRTSIACHESTLLECDRSSRNAHRADPPGRRIDDLHESRGSPEAMCRSAVRLRPEPTKGKDGLYSATKISLRQMTQYNYQGDCNYASTLRNCVTPKSKGRKTPEDAPTQEADEDGTPLVAVNSWGESSVDKLIKQIDEIEDDFNTIVASLPGSNEESSLSLMSLNNSSKSVNAHSLVEITLNNAESFESNASAVSLVTDAVHRMRLMKDFIYQNDSTDESGGISEEGSYNSRGGMSELIQDLNNAAESLRTLNEWDE